METITLNDKIKIIAEAINSFNNYHDVEGIKIENGKYKFSYACTYKGYKVGQWISRRETLGENSKKFTAELDKMGVDVTASARAITAAQKLEIMSKAINFWQNGGELAGISNKNNKIYIINNCVYNGFNIGHWVHNVKNKVATSKELIDGLKDLNINIEPSQKNSHFGDCLNLIKKAINKKVTGVKFLDNGQVKIPYNFGYGGVRLGLMVASAKSGDLTYKSFVDGLKELNVDFSVTGCAVSYKQKVEIIARAIQQFKQGKIEKGIKLKDGKFYIMSNFEFEGHKIGNWTQSIRLGYTVNEKYISMLNNLNVYLEPPISRETAPKI